MKYILDFKLFLAGLIENYEVIKRLTINDFHAKYLGSFLSFFWSFIQPLVLICIFWFVFQVGFKSQPIDNIPFVLWLFAGIIPWFFISESISTATNSIIENSYLVKKVKFRVSILPIIKIISALFIHLVFMILMVFILLYYKIYPSIYWIQSFYYLFAMIILIVGISWITSSLIIFTKDIGQFVALFLQVGFWMTPIFWSLSIVPERYHWILELNPFFYIVEGYRNSFLYSQWFWNDMGLSLYFWSVTIFIFVFGALIFRKSRKHFADVL